MNSEHDGNENDGSGVDDDASWILAKNRDLHENGKDKNTANRGGSSLLANFDVVAGGGEPRHGNDRNDDEDEDEDEELERNVIKSRAAAQASSTNATHPTTKLTAAPRVAQVSSNQMAPAKKTAKPRLMTVAEVATLSPKELRMELRLRNLEAGGLKHHLVRRLEEAIAKDIEAQGEAASQSGGVADMPPPVAPIIITGNRLDIEVLDFTFTPSAAQVPFGCTVFIQVPRSEMAMVEYQLLVTKVSERNTEEEDCCLARSPPLQSGSSWSYDFLEMPGTYTISDSSSEEHGDTMDVGSLKIKVQSTPGWQEVRATLIEQKMRRRKADAMAQKADQERRKVSENAKRAEEERRWREIEEARVEQEAALDKSDPKGAQQRAMERAEAVGESVQRVRAGSGGTWRDRIERKTLKLQAKREEAMQAQAKAKAEEDERRRQEEELLEIRRQRRLAEQRDRETEVELERERLRVLDGERRKAREAEEEKVRKLREENLLQAEDISEHLPSREEETQRVHQLMNSATGGSSSSTECETKVPIKEAIDMQLNVNLQASEEDVLSPLKGSAVLRIEDGEFSPPKREVICGTIVQFFVSEDEPCTIEYELVVSTVSSFDEKSGEEENELSRSEILTPGDSWSYIFETSGMYLIWDPDAPDLRLEVTVLAS